MRRFGKMWRGCHKIEKSSTIFETIWLKIITLVCNFQVERNLKVDRHLLENRIDIREIKACIVSTL
jgi:hypothetical protein